MSGKNHHHIWQMLQRGFGKKEYGDYHIWVYKKGVLPERTITKKFGSEAYFYGPENSDADINITNFENSVQSFIQKARKSEDGEEVDRDICANIITHLEMRSLFLRSELSFMFSRLLETLERFFISPKHFNIFMSKYIKENNHLVEAEITKAIMPDELKPAARELFKENMPFILSQMHTQAKEFAKIILRDLLLNNIDKITKDAQIRIFTKENKNYSRHEMNKLMRYYIYKSKETRFIFPDTSLSFFTKKGCMPFSQKDKIIEGVIFPISSDTLIIGKRDKTFSRSENTIQNSLASCSYEAFISDENSEDLIKLTRLIGKNAKILTEADMNSALDFENILNGDWKDTPKAD